MMPPPGPPSSAVASGSAETWSPFAVLAHEPHDKGQAPGSPAPPIVSTGAGSPRALMLDGGLVPSPRGRTVTTAMWSGAAGPASTSAASPRSQQAKAKARYTQDVVVVGDSADLRAGPSSAAAAAAAGDFDDCSEHPMVKREAYEEPGRQGSLRMALRRRSSSGPARRDAPSGSGGGDDLWADGDDDLDALLGPEEDYQSDDEDDSPKAVPKRKVGRPLKYKGDPNAPHLTEEERRRIKRRIANRESARRVRQKRNEYMEDLQAKCTALSQQNARLLAHVAGIESQNRTLLAQVGLLREKYSVKVGENVQLYNALLHAKRLLMQLQGKANSGELPASVNFVLPGVPGLGPAQQGSGASTTLNAFQIPSVPSGWPLGGQGMPPSPHGDGGPPGSPLQPEQSLQLQQAGVALLQAGVQLSAPAPLFSPAPASVPYPSSGLQGCKPDGGHSTPPLLPVTTSAVVSGPDPSLSMPYGAASGLPGLPGPSGFSSSSSMQLNELMMLGEMAPPSLPPSAFAAAGGPGAPSFPPPQAQAGGAGQLAAQGGMGQASREPSRAQTPFGFI